MFDAGPRAEAIVSRHWLRRLREPGAALVLRGSPWGAEILRAPHGADLPAVLWRGPALVGHAAIRAGLVGLVAQTPQATAWRLTALGAQVLVAWDTERDALAAEIAGLRRALERAEAEFLGDAAAEAIADPRIEGLERAQARIVRRLMAAGGRVLAPEQLHPKNSVAKVQIARIRKMRPDLGRQIETVWGVGYRWRGGADGAAD